MSLFNLFRIIEKGGSGSGNFGHVGRPGKRGGSSSLSQLFSSMGVYFNEKGTRIFKVKGGENLPNTIKDRDDLPFIYNAKTNTYHIAETANEEHAYFTKESKEGNSGHEEGFLIRGRIFKNKLGVWDFSGDRTISNVAGDNRQEQRILGNSIKNTQKKFENNLLKRNGKVIKPKWITPEDMDVDWNWND